MHHLRKYKNFYDKQVTTVTTHKNVQNYYNEKCTNKYALQFAICTKSIELFKLSSPEKTNSFCLIKLLFIKVRCLINVNVSLSSVKWGLLARNEVGIFQTFNHVKTIKNH